MLEIFVDYNRIGAARRFTTPLLLEENEALHVGDRVVVVGDDVEPREATVLALADSGRVAELVFRET